MLLETEGYRDLGKAGSEPAEVPSQEGYDGSIHIAPHATVRMMMLISLETGEPTVAAYLGPGIRGPQGINLPTLQRGETYLVIQSTSTKSWILGGRKPVLEMGYGDP